MSSTGTEVKKSKDVQHGPIHYPLWFGGSSSCLAAGVTHPLDLCEFEELVEGTREHFTDEV